MSSKRYNKTVYQEYVFTNIVARIAEGEGCYPIDDLAQMVGLKPTVNFRKRINQMVNEGLIVSMPAFSPRGSLMKIYCLPATQPELFNK
jgi:hypothetical protein